MVRALNHRIGPSGVSLGHYAAHCPRHRALGGQRGNVGGGPLQHGDVLGRLGQGGNQGHGCGPAPDHHHLLAPAVEIVRPELRMNDTALELVQAGKLGLVPVVVAVVPATREDEATGEVDDLAGVGALGGDVPAHLVAGPVGRNDAVVEPNLLIDARVSGGVPDVLEDIGTVGDRLLTLPGPEGVAQGVHVQEVGADTGVAKEIRAADGVTRDSKIS